MAHNINRLTNRAAQTLSRPGRHADGGNLYLNVTKTGARSWVFMFKIAGRQREMGLGSLRDVSLASARVAAAAARALVREGRDPLAAAEQPKAASMSFGEAADAFLASISPTWRNAKHQWQWRTALEERCAPIRGLPVGTIDTDGVLGLLQPIWLTKPETASRLRARIERVLDFAKARGFRDAENPARWRGHLDKLLPARSKVRAVEHHAALPYDKVPGFIQALRGHGGMGARALEFTILTAARTGETLGATWAEIDIPSRVWTVPASRMKAGKAHRVPLIGRALEIAEQMMPARQAADDFVFLGGKSGRPLSNMAMTSVLRRMGHDDITCHGFRSSFRDWAGEVTSFPREVAEAALAHRVGDETEQAYRRGDALEKRRALMEAWARFCESRPTASVVALRR